MPRSMPRDSAGVALWLDDLGLLKWHRGRRGLMSTYTRQFTLNLRISRPENRMKKILAAWLLFSSVALAQTPNAANWVEVGKFETSNNGFATVYLDVSAIINEEGYSGYKAKTLLENPTPLTDANAVIVAWLATFEFNCATGVARAKRTGLLRTDGQVAPSGDSIWRTLDHPPATDTGEAVKQRVCHR
jgi:hypothetical protein